MFQLSIDRLDGPTLFSGARHAKRTLRILGCEAFAV